MKNFVTVFAFLLLVKTPTISGAQTGTDTQNKMTNPYKQLEQVADLLNLVGKKLKVPEYARTTPLQIRVLRMNLALTSPLFMGVGLSHKGMKKGDSVDTTLSPLQAAHLFCVMIDQKLSNEDYQDPSIDLSMRARERTRTLENMKRTGQVSGNSFVMHRSNPKRTEMHASIASGIDSMSIQDALELLDNMLSSINLK
jgi:hypothetical protein